jgi:hypothetical protein
MKMATALRNQAQGKREMAEVLVRLGPSMSLNKDRELLAGHARGLLAEATGLEAQADALDALDTIHRSN